MNNTLRLVKYHAVFLIIFSFCLLLIFYLFEGGDFNTPIPLVFFYLFSALLLYIPLVFTLTVLNFFVLAIGLSFFRDFSQQVVICLLPILFFSGWYLFSDNPSVLYYWTLSDFQFYSIITIWTCLVTLGFAIYSGLRQYFVISLIPLLLISGWHVCQKYNLTSHGLRITDFHFKVILGIWTTLSSCILFRRYPRSISIDKA